MRYTFGIMHADVRCQKCAKLLAKNVDPFSSFEIKCSKCKHVNCVFGDMKEQIIITDAEGVLVYVNKVTEEVSGYTLAETIGQKPSLWGGQMPREFYKELWRVIREEKRPTQVSVVNKNKSGKMYSADLKISPILDKDGNVRFYVGIEKLIAFM